MQQVQSITTQRLLVFTLLSLAFFLGAGRAAACRIEMPHRPPSLQPLETREHDVSVAMRNQVAEVTVRATFYNPNSVNVEGDYWFPLYNDAAVSSFSMIVNGKEMQAELLDADKARGIYEEIVRQQRDPGLLEFVGTRMLRQRIFPIQPKSEVKVFLKYTQLLDSQSGTVGFKYPLSSAKPDNSRIGKVAISVFLESDAAITNIYSSSHDINIKNNEGRSASVSFAATDHLPDKTFTLYYGTAKNDIGMSLVSHKPLNEDGYFTMLLSPRIDYSQEKIIPKDFVFAIDASGSMSGDKLRGAKEALKLCIQRLNKRDRFNIIRFSSDLEPFADQLRPATEKNKTEAARFVERLSAEGGTAINDALKMSLGQLAEAKGRLPVIVFLTDGLPTVGEQHIGNILKNMQSANRLHARIFAFGVGDNVNTELLDKLAEESGGEKEYVSSAGDSVEVGISALCAKIENPVLTGLMLTFDRSVKVYDLYPKKLPDLFKGGQLVVTGRYRGRGEKQIMLRGAAGDKIRHFEYRGSFTDVARDAFVPRFWALKKMSFLLGEINLRGKNDELVNEIRNLGKKFGIVTPYTSFLIVEEGLRKMTLGARSDAEMQDAFEQEKTGAGAVARSKLLADSSRKSAPAPLAYAAPLAEAPEEKRKEVMAKLEKSIVPAGDKTFILQANGYHIQGDLTEKDSAGAREIKFMGREYFDLLQNNPEISDYLRVSEKIIFKHKGTVYKIIEA